MTTTKKTSSKYSVSMDSTAWLITVLMLCISAYFIYGQIKEYLFSGETNSVIIVAVLTGVFLISLAMRPISYILTDEELIIKRLAGNIRIAKNEIHSVESLDNGRSGTLIRTFGIGGYFGYFGKYYSSSLGSLTLYATRKDKRILVTTKSGKKIVLTPDDSALAADLKK